MSWLEVRFDSRTQVQPDAVVLYCVQVEALNSSGIEKEVFVFDTTQGLFEHVASVYDMLHLPPSQGQATAQDVNYYRSNTLSRSFITSKAAVDLIADIKRRLNMLRYQWDEYSHAPFGGVETVIFSSETQ